MDWFKWFSLLVAVSSASVFAQGTRKKIRIHLPQKVKHIHHHKKVYITNHPASSQYAPAYLPTADGAVAMPTTVALPTVAGLVPVKPMQLFEERQSPPLQGVSPAASKILPLYRTRGYYGPSPEWEDQEYDLVPPPEPLGPTAPAGVLPSAFSAPSAPAASSNYPPKRVKVIKINESPRKKVIRKRKPKRVIIQDMSREEERPPVSTFHEHFYSDLEGADTIRKIKKPKRVEKIIDGDTEHIHTYSEEHIHKLVFDDGPKLTSVAGIEPTGGMSALTASSPLIPIKNSQSLLALDNSEFGGPFGELAAIGTLGTPSQLEYASYNARDVTHDHVFHDHGELPSHIDITKESLAHPPKVSYNSQGLKINGATIKSRPKNKWKSVKPTRPTPPIDFSYYENIYSPPTRPRKPHGRPHQSHKFLDDSSSEVNLDNFRPIPDFNFKTIKPKYKQYGFQGYAKPSSFQLEQESVSIPFSTSSSFYDAQFTSQKGKYPGVNSGSIGFSNFKDPFTSFKDIYTNNFEYDTYASSSNMYNKENEPKEQSSSWPIHGKNKKKSISTQNISFGGQDHKTVVDHLADSSNTQSSKEKILMRPSSSAQTYEDYSIKKSEESATPSMEYTITEHSPAHDYYTSMALKAFQEDPMELPEASNNNFQIVEAPTPQTTPLATTPRPTPTYYSIALETTTATEMRSNPPGINGSKRFRSRNKFNRNLEPSTSQFTPITPDENNGIDNPNIKTSEQDRREAFHRLEREYQRSRRGRNNYQNKREMTNLDQHITVGSKYGDKL